MNNVENILEFCKRESHFTYFNEGEGSHWIGDGKCFLLDTDESEITPALLVAVTKLSPKALQNTVFTKKNLSLLYNLGDDDKQEQSCTMALFQIEIEHEKFYIVYAPDGVHLLPSRYFQDIREPFVIYSRKLKKGDGIYFAIKKGMLLRAIICDAWNDKIMIHSPGIAEFAQAVKNKGAADK